jgi:hypothetical protein
VDAQPYELAWYGCDLRTGGIVEDLRSLKPTGALSRKLGDFTTTSFDLTIPGAPDDWVSATDGGRSMFVAVDTATDIPVWAGVVLPRDRGSAQTASISTATLEKYLDSRYPGDQTYIGTDQATVVAGLITPALTNGPPFQIDGPATGTVMDYSVADSDDKSILSCLQEIMGLDGGPEWTVDIAWNTARDGFVLPFRIRAAIGSQATTPEATFDYPGSVSTYTQSESYEQGKGANVVIARGEGEGSSRLTSSPYTATALIANGWPQWEYRFTPATGLTDPDQLNAHAAKALALMQEGARVWTVEAVASRAPRIGRDFAIGDTVRIAVETSPGHPAGADVVARCWSWELDPSGDKVRPILVEE